MALKCDIVIVGGGVLGLCVAVELTARGHRVIVLDPGAANASSVAAGMIAPAMESVLDGATSDRARLLREAADLWPEFARRTSIALKPGPSVWRGDSADEVANAARRLGFAADVRDGGVWTDDRQVEPEPALVALRRRAGHVVAGEALSLTRSDGGWAVGTAEGTVKARAVVLATGAAAPPEGVPESVMTLVNAIVPIRGQIGWTGEPAGDVVVRGESGYLAPMGKGTVIGASMGTGRRDLSVDGMEAETLLAVAERLTARDLRDRPVAWRVGIRGATPDGLPMAGPSGEPGLHLALAPRRNGWLLGPLVGQSVADGIEGLAPAPPARALDPQRFSRPAG
ncbi:FAD-dependent oxidoreductase [Brevundimonas variabilis]|uniref:Glycine oxidase n=1 Tax=Brevundimonas variabilis TaxID=74312 RepID=A0A7W9CI80_9CAUL|nr:glycine oxidase [Brevundimonas variabilis]